MLVALAGKARVGKDTIGRFIAQEYGYEHYYFAKPLKDMLTAMGFPESEYQTTEAKERLIPELGFSYRHLAQTLGTEWGRELINPELWIKLAARRWAQVKDAMSVDTFAPNGMVITDCRFDNEAAWVRSAGGIVIHVLGDNQFAGMTEQTRAHKSEKGVTFVESYSKPEGEYGGDRLLFNHYEQATAESLRTLYASVYAVMDGLR